MDHPINVEPFEFEFEFEELESPDTVEIEDRDAIVFEDLSGRLLDAIQCDDKDYFLRTIRNPGAKQYRLYFNFIQQIFRHDALEIGLALFNGETEDLIDLKGVQYEGMTQLHFAAANRSHKLAKYFIERGDNVDVLCDCKRMNMKQATPLDLSLELIDSGSTIRDYPTVREPRPWSTRKSILELFVYLVNKTKPDLDIIRMLVQNTSNKDRVRQTFIDCANNGELVRLSALFLAAPDLFLSHNVSLRSSLSSIGTLYHALNSLEKRTDIEEALLLLLDVFTIIGDKLVAYVRLEEYNDRDFKERTIAFLLDEVAHRKPAVSSPDDYYLRFFNPVRPEPDQLLDYPRYLPEDRKTHHEVDGRRLMHFHLKRKDITIHYINRMFYHKSPKPVESGLLYKAIDNKLSSMSTFCGLFEAVAKTTNKSSVRPVNTSAKPWIKHKFLPVAAWVNKEMPQTKLQSILSFIKLSYFPIFAKRLIK